MDPWPLNSIASSIFIHFILKYMFEYNFPMSETGHRSAPKVWPVLLYLPYTPATDQKSHSFTLYMCKLFINTFPIRLFYRMSRERRRYWYFTYHNLSNMITFKISNLVKIYQKFLWHWFFNASNVTEFWRKFPYRSTSWAFPSGFNVPEALFLDYREILTRVLCIMAECGCCGKCIHPICPPEAAQPPYDEISHEIGNNIMSIKVAKNVGHIQGLEGQGHERGPQFDVSCLDSSGKIFHLPRLFLVLVIAAYSIGRRCREVEDIKWRESRLCVTFASAKKLGFDRS